MRVVRWVNGVVEEAWVGDCDGEVVVCVEDCGEGEDWGDVALVWE